MSITYKKSDVAIVEHSNEAKAIKKGLDLIKAKELVINHQGKKVLIIPNFVNMKKPNPTSAITVGDDSLSCIIKYFKEIHNCEVVVGCGSGGGNTNDIVKKIGYDRIFKEESVKFIDFNKGAYDTLNIKHEKPKKLKINKIINEADIIISFTQLKHHEESTMSWATKNVMLSIPSSEEHGTPKKNLGIHEDLHGFITAMAEKVKVDISIVSANPAMIGTGPTKGVARHTGLVLIGNNPISTDVVGARLLGFKPQGINYLYQLENKQIAKTNVEDINIYGMPLNKAEKVFSTRVYGDIIQVDKE